MPVAAPGDFQLQLDGERVDDGDADAMQAAGDLVGILVELAARMQLRHDDFGGGDALLMHVGRNAAAIVGDGAGAVGIKRDGDEIGMAGQRLVNGVVHDLIDHVMQAGPVIGVADIHAGPLAHRVEALQHLDRVGAIFLRVECVVLRAVLWNVSHEKSLISCRLRVENPCPNHLD